MQQSGATSLHPRTAKTEAKLGFQVHEIHVEAALACNVMQALLDLHNVSKQVLCSMRHAINTLYLDLISPIVLVMHCQSELAI